MVETDRRGLALTTRSGDAAAHYREGVERFMRGRPGSADAFAASCAADPGFCEGYVGQAFAALYDGEAEAAGSLLAIAEGCAGDGRSHGQRAAVSALNQFDLRSGERLGRSHLEAYPCDELAREAVGLLLFFHGRSEEIADLYDWLAPRQGDDWGFAASWSFACHEVGRLAESQVLGESALAARPDHAFAVHSLTHVAYESGRHAEGDALIETFFSSYEPIAYHRRHLHWHRALHLLALGRDGDAAALWPAAIGPTSVPTRLGAVDDGASLLWRWHLYGASGWTLPWEELADLSRHVAALPVVPLSAACAAIVLAAVGDEDALSTLLVTAGSMQAAGMLVPAQVLAAVATAATASFAGRWDEVATALWPVRAEFASLGGSRAQRELFEDALITGLLRSGRADEARPLLDARLARRPSARDAAWVSI